MARIAPTEHPVAEALLIVLLAAAALADSPLVSIDIAGAYGEVVAVQRARTGELDRRVVDFLLSDAPFDQKAAAIDAFGWAVTGRDNAGRFARALAVRRGGDPLALTIADLGPSEKFALGFLIAKDHYQDLAALSGSDTGLDGLTAQRLLGDLARDLPDDFAVQLVYAMVRAQEAMPLNHCDVWRIGDAVLSRFPAESRNVRKAAVRSAEAFWAPYESDCGGPSLGVTFGEGAPSDPDFDEINAMLPFRGQLVTATQAGVVFWGPSAPTASRSEPVCTELLVADDSLWVGCSSRLLRWDGALWSIELEGAGGAYGVALGPDGTVRARSGEQSWARDRARGAFFPTRGESGHEVLWRGESMWRIDLLTAITAGERRFRLKSVEYPGGDPRQLVEDAEGRLWATDVERGLLVYDEAAEKFVQAGPVRSRGAGVAVDSAHGRTWYLHETDGVWLVDASGSQLVGLRSQGKLRAIWLDERGDPWIGSTNGLVHLQPVNGAWAPEVFRVSGR